MPFNFCSLGLLLCTAFCFLWFYQLSNHCAAYDKYSTYNLQTGEEEVYTIVGTTEADPFENRISNESPVGAAILGQKVNTVVQVNTPVGELAYKIVKVD